MPLRALSEQLQTELEELPTIGFVLILALLVLHKIAFSLISPQLFAEDGPIFFSGAVEGVGLLKPLNGFAYALPRMVAAVGLWVSPYALPLYFNVATALALLLAAIAVYVIAPSSLSRATRMLMAVALVLAPTNNLAYGNLTNLHWLTAPLLLLVPLDRTYRSLRLILLAVIGLTGPVVLIFAPVFIVAYIKRWRDRSSWVGLAVFVIVAALQVHSYLTSGRPSVGVDALTLDGIRNVMREGVAGPVLGFPILLATKPQEVAFASGVVWSLPEGASSTSALIHNVWIFDLCSFAIASVLVAETVKRGSWLLGIMLMAFACASAATIVGAIPLGEEKFIYGSGGRYFVVPSILMFWVAALLALEYRSLVGRVLLVLIVVAGIAGYQKRPLPVADPSWDQQVKEALNGERTAIETVLKGWPIRVDRERPYWRRWANAGGSP